MHMLYNSDSFAVVLFDVAADLVAEVADGAAVDSRKPASTDPRGPVAALGARSVPTLNRGGYEIVDKFARKEIFLQGAMAESFKQGVEALIQTQPSEEEMDDYIERFASLMQQPVILH